MKKLIHHSHYLLKFIVAVILILSSSALFSQVSPVTNPKGGFKIDGQLRANTPGSPAVQAGDWVPRVNGTAFGAAGVPDSFVLSSAGVPKDNVTTRLQRDLYNSNLDDIFTQGSKFNDAVSSLHHGLGGAPNKNDIHNGVFHASADNANPAANQWVFIGGDRLDVAGTSYIDFQFLQGTITTNASTFTGSGPCGGRTVNDINISMEYNNGGSAPKVVIYRWVPTNDAGTAGIWDSTGSSAITDAYAKTNLVTVDVPFGGFGVDVFTYQPFAFVEAGINVTQLVTALGGNCSGLSIKTLWITTKASSSSTAALKDFMAPISIDLSFGGVSIDSKGPVCLNGGNIALTGLPAGGTFSGPGVSGSTFNPTASDAGVGSHTIVYTATAGANCTKSATMVIEVRPLPTATISGSTTVCKDAASPFIVIQGAGGTKPYTFSYNIGGGSTLQRTTTGTNDTVRINVPTGTATTHVYNLVSVQESSTTTTCSQNQTGSATVVVNPKPSASIEGTTSVCKDATSPFVVFTGSGGTRPYTFSYTLNGGGTLTRITTGSFDTARIAAPTGTAGTFTYALTGVSDPNCSNTASGSAVITITPKPTASITGATTVCKDATAPFVVFTGAGGTRPYTFSYTLNGGGTLTRITTGSFDTARIAVPTGTPGTSTYVLTGVSDANCSNTASGTEAVTVNSVPTAPTICIIQPSLCGPAKGIIKVISPLTAGYKYSKDDGQTWQDCNVFLNVDAGSNPVIRYKTDLGCVSASATCGDATTCTETPVACQGGNFARVAPAQTTLTEESPLTIKAYPNPFSDKVKFVVTSPVAGDGNLELYNMMGQKVKNIYSGHFAQGSQTFEISLPASQVATLVYVLRIGGKQVTGKLLQVGNRN